MLATPDKSTRRESGEQARARALVRFNGPMFHSLATASFLETAVPAQAHRLSLAFAACPDVALWLEQIWWPQRAETGRRLREYVEATWPEFDWNAAYQEYDETCRSRRSVAGGRRGLALEALGLCATASQAAAFYRALAGCADEPVLRALARQAAAHHAASFDYFRALFERCKERERVGLAESWRAVAASCRAARDNDVRAAFEPLGRNWAGVPTVPELDYGEYRARMAPLIRRHAALGCLERLLFRPWLEPAPARRAPVTVPARPRGGFPPVLQAAAA